MLFLNNAVNRGLTSLMSKLNNTKIANHFTHSNLKQKPLHDELVALNHIPHVQSRAEEATANLKQWITLRLIAGL